MQWLALHPQPTDAHACPSAQADFLAFLVHALLLCVGYLSPWSMPHLTTKQCCQGLAGVLPLPLLLFQRTREW